MHFPLVAHTTCNRMPRAMVIRYRRWNDARRNIDTRKVPTWIHEALVARVAPCRGRGGGVVLWSMPGSLYVAYGER